MVIIDPMHNLLLGTAKRVMNTWIKCRVIGDEDLVTIQTRVDNVQVPSHVGRIPAKIAASFLGFSADQWKNWVCIYSPVALKGIIPDRDYNCWLLFVRACKYFTQKHISHMDLQQADALLETFCQHFSEIYGSSYCTINMHLHLHLSEWRINGLLSKMPNNGNDICLQLMKKCLVWSGQGTYNCPVMDLIQGEKDGRGTMNNYTVNHLKHDELQKKSIVLNLCNTAWTEESYHQYEDIDTFDVLEKYEMDKLSAMFTNLYNEQVHVSEFMSPVTNVSQTGICIPISKEACDPPRDIVFARWAAQPSGPQYKSLEVSSSAAERPAVIRGLFLAEVWLNFGNKRRQARHLLASVLWLKSHPNKQHYGPDSDITVWTSDYEPSNSAAVLPLQRITRCGVITRQIVQFSPGHSETAQVAIPLQI